VREGDRSLRWIRLRISALAALLIAALLGLLGRAAFLEVRQGRKLSMMAQEQYRFRVPLPGQRGAILDRRGASLATSVQVDSIFVDPSQLTDAPQAAADLSAALHVDRHALEHRLDPQSQFVWVKRQASATEAEAVRRLGLSGAGFVKENQRFYPERELAAQLLGLAGLDGEGLEGLELYYDGILRGTPQTLSGVRDARGNVVTDQTVEPSTLEGVSLQLTLDRGIQYLTQQALRRAVGSTHAVAGMAVVLEPSTGAILAMAISPSFNPNALGPSERGALRNRLVADCYEPGSTFKAFLVAGALRDGILGPNSLIQGTDGAFAVGDRTIHNDHKSAGSLTVSRMVQVSSNIGAAKVGLMLGRQRLHAIFSEFGFGDRTGIGLPGESKGNLPEFRSDIAAATASFGQGVTATAMQLVAAYGALANGGRLMRPHVVARMIQPDGSFSQVAPESVRQVVSPEVARAVTHMLEGVVEKGGTAEAAAVEGFRVAGKTGTAQKVDPVLGGYSVDKRFSSFIGYLPVEAPRLVVGVFLDEPKGQVYGGIIAAPVFREIAAGALQQLGVSPSVARVVAPQTRPSRPPSLAQEQAAEDDGEPVEVQDDARSRVPSVLGMPARRAIAALAASGLLASIEGEGRVISQHPSPGAEVPPSGTIRLQLRSADAAEQPR
jgi:cell division protein FtsI (penicillin-binding protein 3)